MDDIFGSASVAGKPLDKVFSVGEYIQFLNVFFEQQTHRVLGEICEFKIGPSGHVYFTIKDKDGSAVIDVKMWKGPYDRCGIRLSEGLEVIVNGHANIWAKNGRLSLIADAIELVGEGALKKQYDALKNKLETEGFFEAGRKRKLPEFPERIGVITSKNGAVIHDFLNNLGRFGFKITMIDARVEGQVAVADLLTSVQAMRKEEIDLLILIRGGGSLESLQAFNNEALIREVMNFPVPVIAGIGHDKDVPLLALAADYMTSTPTAAAHLVSRPWEEAYAKLREVAYLPARMMQEAKRIAEKLDAAWQILCDQAIREITHGKEQIDYAERFLRINDPRRHLKLGYAIVRHNGRVVRTIRGINPGEALQTELSDGVIDSSITGIK